MPRFVILLHECPPSFERPTHYDLMLADGESLRTWALEREPVAGEAIDAVSLAEHRLAYLDYEGPVSGDRGTVSQYDRGSFEWRCNTADTVEVQLEGEKLQGTLRLVRDEEDRQRWSATFC